MDLPISELTEHSGPASGLDLIEMVDVSDDTMHANGTNKKKTVAEFKANGLVADAVRQFKVLLHAMAGPGGYTLIPKDEHGNDVFMPNSATWIVRVRGILLASSSNVSIWQDIVFCIQSSNDGEQAEIIQLRTPSTDYISTKIVPGEGDFFVGLQFDWTPGPLVALAFQVSVIEPMSYWLTLELDILEKVQETTGSGGDDDYYYYS